jgi:ATP-dependent Clp protease protease subunit
MADSTTKADITKKKGEDAGPPIGRHLLKARSVLLFGPIEPKVTKAAVTQLLVLDQMSATEPIKVYVNSPGGLADDGFAVYDVMRYVKAPVYTICTGLAASAATIVMVGATEGHRYSLPHSRLMLHQPSQGARGTASDISIAAKEIIRLRQKANELFAAATGHDIEKIQKDMHRDFWMSAEEAKEYGLIDGILTSAEDLPKA